MTPNVVVVSVFSVGNGTPGQSAYIFVYNLTAYLTK